MSIPVLTTTIGAVLIMMAMGGAKDIGDVGVSKNENDGGNTAIDDNTSNDDKNSDSAVELDKS